MAGEDFFLFYKGFDENNANGYFYAIVKEGISVKEIFESKMKKKNYRKMQIE
jgi:hypothetical protein